MCVPFTDKVLAQQLRGERKGRFACVYVMAPSSQPANKDLENDTQDVTAPPTLSVFMLLALNVAKSV